MATELHLIILIILLLVSQFWQAVLRLLKIPPFFSQKHTKIMCHPKSIEAVSVNVSRFSFCQMTDRLLFVLLVQPVGQKRYSVGPIFKDTQWRNDSVTSLVHSTRSS